MRIKTAKKPMTRAIVKKTVRCAAAKPAAKKATAKAVVFTVHGEKGHNVFLAGEFNKWNPTAKKMAFKGGVYRTSLKLAAGTYQYKFVIDGTWCADPENVNSVPNDQGTFNSVITVK